MVAPGNAKNGRLGGMGQDGGTKYPRSGGTANLSPTYSGGRPTLMEFSPAKARGAPSPTAVFKLAGILSRHDRQP